MYERSWRKGGFKKFVEPVEACGRLGGDHKGSGEGDVTYSIALVRGM